MQGTWKTWKTVIAIPMQVSSFFPTLMHLFLLQTPMGEWLHLQERYLHLLLEMEGLTKAPKCSICINAMEVKCSDCMGGNYFCKACCIQSHRWTPFHQMAWWTGAHFTPVSLYSLGFVPPLGHHGDPCPLTVEVYCICHKATARDEQLIQSGCFLQATSKLKLCLPSQCWMTSWQIIWSVRPQHSNIIQSSKAEPIACSLEVSQYVNIPFQGNGLSPMHWFPLQNLYKQLLQASLSECNIQGPLSHTGHKGTTAEEDIRLY